MFVNFINILIINETKIYRMKFREKIISLKGSVK